MNFVKKAPQKTYYDVLEISQDSDPKEIKEAFVKLSKEFHPDKCQNVENAHEKFVKINEAYSVLSRDRKTYDEFLKNREVETQFDGDQRVASAYEHWQKYGYQKGPEPRKYSHFYKFCNSKEYKFDPPQPSYPIINPKLQKKLILGLSLAVIVGFVTNFFFLRKISKYRDANSKKQSEINSIMYSYNRNLRDLYGNETFNKLVRNEIKNMTLAEAAEEYERRHREKKHK